MRADLIEIIKEDLIKHEGYRDEIYLDSEGLPTFGIGHLIVEDDIEHQWPVGTKVTAQRIDDVFLKDLKEAVDDAECLVSDLYSLPDQCIRVLVNMAFNLGRPRLSGFKNMLAAVEAKDFEEAANQMIDSRWYNQVGGRSVELENWMRNA